MSGNLVNGGSAISCPHGGRVGPASAPSSGVRIDGHQVPSAADVFTVSGCRHTVDGVPHPCVTVRWTPDRDSVLVDGAPVLLDSTSALCFSAALLPQGPPAVGATTRGVSSR
ncbi:hypothetical protein HRW23_08125 [Streptomyces lunaelactis]|uniref:hypothetical protein n=1 Tax=Streptomyces lunaelactis TaxID=1535768 RepID=UPI001585AEB3|nr:hypothetical protein [Streptomyces lunaelactis]NUK00854.1 hypothetical protein [Streptomyces lunaelactis]NUK07385.1 hypothetical protein [Streptomyces lunaelactis]NUK14789.1 hypothetical protein [Streptomyces lunaelactis]NUK22171.1 hypothetical protein [Streptomyces lunaelactis]NUK34186.1 hypothetical protein [Streptomyces lunaelactis]